MRLAAIETWQPVAILAPAAAAGAVEDALDIAAADAAVADTEAGVPTLPAETVFSKPNEHESGSA